ncbi:complex I 51 kDa subunit family protein [Fuchsiella alkaliacetigena]|uniref:complex I 51 kDa subunit family protein n=1 Tax=Fuchsiella alkaliacetigena TaxID=957042 RepID=UPI00200B55C6|nr:NADH-ubiquinone oxidoreductase-F iron-sulfur binding region domain-containing protein [Fuchsiella alkaliacetigena]MCK8824640.1 SLBB domain-containing protein [Fuchsiella alkaliacetigena]
MEEKILLKEGIDIDLKGRGGDTPPAEPNINEYDFFVLEEALNLDREEIIEQIKEAYLKGRGGAGFPTGLKWEMALAEEAEQKYMICNADEAETGTFKDRYLLENVPFKVLEGIIIGAYAIGAEQAYIYMRGEYARPRNVFSKAIEEAYKQGLLGEDILGSGFNLELRLIKGAGAYICGEETALLNSIEGKRGRSRTKPPYPIQKGLFDQPTAVNNVETLASCREIIRIGAKEYKSLGTKESRGTKLVCLSGDIWKPGVYEVEFGQVTIKEIVEEYGGGTRDDAQLKFIIPGGASTSILPAEKLDIPYCYETLAQAGSSVGSGAIIVVDDSHNLFDLMVTVSRFFMDETCGTCFPCKEGNRQVNHILNKVADKGGFSKEEVEIVKSIGRTIYLSARCGLGQTSLNFIYSILKNYPDEVLLGGDKHGKD